MLRGGLQVVKSILPHITTLFILIILLAGKVIAIVLLVKVC